MKGLRRFIPQVSWEVRNDAATLTSEMLGELTLAQVEQVLNENIIGRIGCHAYGRTYVVPITYAYDGTHVYAHSGEGMKLHMMRMSPRVCFEVDHMDDLANWTSVIAWGTFEELHGDEADRAMAFLIDRIEPLVSEPPGASVHPKSGTVPAVLYRIKLEEKSGRFERRL
jgi:nitroimidazol reductase NimA-like FMN-containing flavoprotein (pyridoxamine 5'-phosphate oxidase superfamily)